MIDKDKIPEKSKTLKKQCKDCPYSKTVVPGGLGGAKPEVYIGQGHGPFYLPCHKTCDFNDPNWKDNVTNPKQCAGAAIYRANIERADIMPKSLLKLPKNNSVFESPEELYSHHAKVSMKEAELFLKSNDPEVLMRKEIIIANELNKKS
jgi:hypothetical protein